MMWLMQSLLVAEHWVLAQLVSDRAALARKKVRKQCQSLVSRLCSAMVNGSTSNAGSFN
jgi:hypothetical protein